MYLSQIEVERYRAAEAPFRLSLPGRLAVIVGGNNSGKTTICDAIYQGFPNRFPQIPRPIAEVVHGNFGRIELTFAASGGAASDMLAANGPRLALKVARKQGRASFTRESAGSLFDDTLKNVMAIYLPADRQPALELGRENSLLIVQLLRTVAADPAVAADLPGLYHRAKALLNSIVEDPLVLELERRLRERMTSVSAGTANQVPHVGTSAMNQRLLARILELLLGEEAKETARRLDLSGLGYANLLYLSAILTALPRSGDGSVPDATPSHSQGDQFGDADGDDFDHSAAALPSAADDSEASAEAQGDGDVFPLGTPLFVLLVEEPEAHLHPQLQAGVLQELRRLVLIMPTLQVIVTTHSPEILAMAEPAEIVVMPGQRLNADASTYLANPVPLVELRNALGEKVWDDTQRLLRLHLDATRSAAVFADEVMLVEGPTDALLLRRFGLAWADGDAEPSLRIAKRRFVDALSIVPMNQKVGEWPVRLLATTGHEIAWRVAVVRDSDRRPKPAKKGDPRPTLTEQWLNDNPPSDPTWQKQYKPETVGVFQLHPTLEPALWRVNADLVAAAIGVTPPVAADNGEFDGDDENEIDDPLECPAVTDAGWTLDSVDRYFQSGAGKRRKGIVSLRIADAISQTNGAALNVPDRLSAAFSFLWDGFDQRTNRLRLEDNGTDDEQIQAD